jgi:anti-anti-sigma factor
MMSIGETSQGAAACLAVEGEMTIYRAAELHPVLLDAVRTHDAPALDLSEVTEFDCAGMQLLLVARREAQRLGKQLVLQGASPAVLDAFALLGMTCAGEIAGETK